MPCLCSYDLHHISFRFLSRGLLPYAKQPKKLHALEKGTQEIGLQSNDYAISSG